MRVLLIALPLLVLAVPAAAQERSKRLDAVVDCRKIIDSTERLACYDKAVADLDTAEKSREVVVVDRAQVDEAQRSVFGLKLPKIRLFGGDGDNEVAAVESVVTSVGRNRDGKLVFTIEDGARWAQTDNHTIVGVRVGTKVTLTRGALGSFFAKFHGSTSAKVERIN
jgi:hypothetical protein